MPTKAGYVMPYSSDEGKDYTRTFLSVCNPTSVLDIGPGAGTYGRMVRSLPGGWRIRCMAIEVCVTYVSQFDLPHLYDQVIVGDARTTPFPDVDVVILGDVLEHMHEYEAVAVWYKALAAAKTAVFLSIPTVPWPQEGTPENPHEAHVSDWTPEKVLATFPYIDSYMIGEEVSVFVAKAPQVRSYWN
jgi:hypothetical protein